MRDLTILSLCVFTPQNLAQSLGVTFENTTATKVVTIVSRMLEARKGARPDNAVRAIPTLITNLTTLCTSGRLQVTGKAVAMNFSRSAVPFRWRSAFHHSSMRVQFQGEGNWLDQRVPITVMQFPGNRNPFWNPRQDSSDFSTNIIYVSVSNGEGGGAPVRRRLAPARSPVSRPTFTNITFVITSQIFSNGTTYEKNTAYEKTDACGKKTTIKTGTALSSAGKRMWCVVWNTTKDLDGAWDPEPCRVVRMELQNSTTVDVGEAVSGDAVLENTVLTSSIWCECLVDTSPQVRQTFKMILKLRSNRLMK